MVVSPGPLSGLPGGGDGWDLEEGKVEWGVMVHGAKLMEDGGGRESGMWLLGGGVTWGRDWLGLRREEEGGCWGRAARAPGWMLDGGCFAGGVASGSGERLPGGVMGGRDTDVSRRVWLPSGD